MTLDRQLASNHTPAVGRCVKSSSTETSQKCYILEVVLNVM